MSTSAPLLAELDRLLQQEVEAYEHLLALHQEIQRCLAAPALDPLLANLQAREHVACHLADVEHHRAAVTAQLASLLQLPVTDVTLQHLSTRVGARYASRWRQYRTRLRTLVDEVQQLNSTQAQLLREVRAFVDTALDFLTRLLSAQPTYLQSGKLTTPTHAGTPPLREGLTAMGNFGGILFTGQQALLAHQTALQVSGQNIANANTPGYSRERAELVSVPSSSTRIMRSGVHVEEITRAYDRFITTQVAVASSNLKGTQTQADLLGQVEALFNDLNTPETGLSGALEAFFQGLHDLAQHPQGLSERNGVLQQGQNVAEAFHQLANGLQGLYQGRNAELGDAVTDVNHLTTQLARLNLQIREREVDPKNHANTLRDQQDLLLKQQFPLLAYNPIRPDHQGMATAHRPPRTGFSRHVFSSEPLSALLAGRSLAC